MKITSQTKKMLLIVGVLAILALIFINGRFLEGFAAPGGSPCDTNEDCDSSFCQEKEGVKMCAESEVKISSA